MRRTLQYMYGPSTRVSYRDNKKTEGRRIHTASWITHSPGGVGARS